MITDKDEKSDPPRLQYIGFSYGTVLGNYFASMYPGRVQRMILDGVTDAVDWTHGPGWLTNIVDMDGTFDRFWDGCHQAGPSICALAKPSDTSSAEPKARFWAWVESLDAKPRSTIRAATGAIVTFSGYDVRSVVGKALTDPLTYFLSTAEALDQAMSGNDTLLVERLIRVGQIASLQDIYPVGGVFTAPTPIRESPSSIYCGDGEDISGKDVAWWQEYINYQVGLSRLYGSFWASVRFACSSWPFRPNWEFRGPFTSPTPDPGQIPGHPAAPLLFLSNRLDPVTPLRSARAMAVDHPGAAVVIQEALGHCVIGTAPSKCVWKIVADYFESGTVPSKETVCEADCGPWDKDCSPF
ncbi:hypothetical protein PT974_09898 [Cladobotryum mycophilum]|uniref:Peptidase S33 tripeptidyl aminopeptidase-like C-terminal domain-containing protein n=1 Tax=Cladobotryum mycophilum TaxID=491253 RepID=A0ABR0SHG2_9HYPO